MTLVGMIIMYLIAIVANTGITTLIGIVLFIVSDVMKKEQLTKKKNAEMNGDYSYPIKKTYKIPRAFGYIFMIPLILFLFKISVYWFP